MPKGYPRYECEDCERAIAECGSLSKQGLCERCAAERLASNIEQLRNHHGPNFLRWRRNMALSVGGLLVDDEPKG